jgi:hypothetical protein
LNDTEHPADTKPELRSLSPKRKVLLSIFVSIYVGCAWLMACPKQWIFARDVLSPIASGLQYLGFWYDPNLFAPDPPKRLHRYDWQLTFNDGSTVHWTYPIDGTFVWDKKLYERLFSIYMSAAGMHNQLYVPFARYLAREHQTAGRTPVAVEIVSYETRIAPPESNSTAPQRVRRRVLYDYNVLPEDLP